MSSNVPLSIQTSVSDVSSPSIINIGGNRLSFSDPAYTGLYWIVILDRSDLSVKLNINFSSNNAVPPALAPFLPGNSQYIMILSTYNLSSANLPTGKFYNFLISEGAGAKLKTLEQIYAAFNCSSWGRMGYALVTVLNNSPSGSFEFKSETYNDQLMASTLLLDPIQIGSQTLYTPIELR